MKQISFVPNKENTSIASAFVEESLLEEACPLKIVTKVNIVFDELFTNIVTYSGASKVTIYCGLESGEVILQICDNGKQFDPTKAEEPDTSLNIDERQIGGLGIHMVKKLMDSLEYQYIDGQNTITVKKKV